MTFNTSLFAQLIHYCVLRVTLSSLSLYSQLSEKKTPLSTLSGSIGDTQHVLAILHPRSPCLSPYFPSASCLPLVCLFVVTARQPRGPLTMQQSFQSGSRRQGLVLSALAPEKGSLSRLVMCSCLGQWCFSVGISVVVRIPRVQGLDVVVSLQYTRTCTPHTHTHTQ